MKEAGKPITVLIQRESSCRTPQRVFLNDPIGVIKDSPDTIVIYNVQVLKKHLSFASYGISDGDTLALIEPKQNAAFENLHLELKNDCSRFKPPTNYMHPLSVWKQKNYIASACSYSKFL